MAYRYGLASGKASRNVTVGTVKKSSAIVTSGDSARTSAISRRGRRDAACGADTAPHSDPRRRNRPSEVHRGNSGVLNPWLSCANRRIRTRISSVIFRRPPRGRDRHRNRDGSRRLAEALFRFSTATVVVGRRLREPYRFGCERKLGLPQRREDDLSTNPCSRRRRLALLPLRPQLGFGRVAPGRGERGTSITPRQQRKGLAVLAHCFRDLLVGVHDFQQCYPQDFAASPIVRSRFKSVISSAWRACPNATSKPSNPKRAIPPKNLQT
jgi:hypothetical protein